ncbi:hypothetical protein Tco_0730481 [Tanacetum coccineum]|uniref:Uncharacterized protein n=1 Tax=Tanacetum coccineum TaxID=301880 RepID=A0ABQ4YSU9_9ASTR
MVGGVEIPQTRTSSGVRSTEEMESAINDLTSKFASMSTVLEEKRSAIVGGGNHQNRKGNECETLDEFNRGPRRGDQPRTMVDRNVNPRGYDEQQSYRVKAEVPNFVGNLDTESVLDWLYERLSLTPIWSVDQAQDMAMKAEKMVAKTGVRSNVCPKLSTYYSIESGNDGLIIDDAFQEGDEELEEKICSIIIDGGGYKSLVSKALVKAFKLPSEPHPSSYQIGWIKKGLKLKVAEICKVPLAIRKHYNELVTCDVVVIDSCHRKNYCYVTSRCRLSYLVTLVASPKEFQAERKEMGVSYALVVKGVEDVIANAILAAIKPLLAEFGKIVADDTPDALPPLRNF